MVHASEGPARPGVSVELSPSVSEKDEVDDSPSSKLGGRAAHELSWLGETPSSGRGRLAESEGSLVWSRRHCLLKRALATEDL